MTTNDINPSRPVLFHGDVFNAWTGEFSGTLVHDRHSHAADAFRGLAVRHKTPTLPKPLSYDNLVYQFPSAVDWMRM